MTSRVTVVVPNYNGARYLGGTLRSLLDQTVPDVPLILLDNCSTDNSVAVAEGLGDRRVRIVRADTHVSMADNWTRALTLADTPYAVLAHADDLYEPEYLGVMVPLLEAHPRAFIAHSRVASMDEQGRHYEADQELVKDLSWPPTETYERSVADEFAVLQRANYILAPSVILRTSVARRIGPFNETYQFVTDWEFWLRGLLAGHTIAGTRRRLVHYRRHRASSTQAHQATMQRYQEEIDLLLWAAREGHLHGLVPSSEPDLRLVRNTILADFADRLERGQRDGARMLLDFARERIPGFRGSPRHLLMAAALRSGRWGGVALRGAQAAYIGHVRRKARRSAPR